MAHKTLIGGTAYKINGGKTLVDGTAYSIRDGKTLVDGTAYKVLLDENLYVSLYGYYGDNENDDNYSLGFDDTCGYATINGIKYTSKTENIPIRAGTQISLKVSASHSDQQYKCSVKLNGTIVQNGAGTYYFTPTKDCKIKFRFYSAFVNWTYINYWTAEITM